MIELAFTQHSGKHPVQQDALWVDDRVYQKRNLGISTRRIENAGRAVIAVADGIASSPFAERASRVVLESLASEISNEANFNTQLIRRVHGRMCDALAKGHTFGTSTTLTAIELRPHECRVLSIGDSRAYCISAQGVVRQLTRDHTVLNGMIDRGEADAQTEYASFYAMLEDYLIADDENLDFPVHYSLTRLHPQDAVLLCTDGVHDALGDEGLASLTNRSISPLAQVEVWRSAVLKAGALDNFSMIFATQLSG